MALTTSHDVAVLGCGLMGSALAQALARGGKSVAVWNRTHQKAEALADNAITPIQEIGEAVRSAPLVVVCLATYDNALAALGPASDLTGTTLVNVGSAAQTSKPSGPGPASAAPDIWTGPFSGTPNRSAPRPRRSSIPDPTARGPTTARACNC